MTRMKTNAQMIFNIEYGTNQIHEQYSLLGKKKTVFMVYLNDV